MSATGAVEEAGTSPKKLAVDFESEEVSGRGPVGKEPGEARRLGVFRCEDSVRGGPRELGMFFRLVPMAGQEAAEEVVPAAGRVKEG